MPMPHDIAEFRDDTGAALMEMLVALAIVALVAVGMAGLSLTASSAQQRIDQEARTLSDQIIAQRLFKSLLGSAQPTKRSGHLEFSGNASSLSFVARSPFEALPAGDYDVQLSIDTSEDKALVMRLSPRTAGAPTVEHVLTYGAEAFSYLGSDLGAYDPSWRESWSQPLYGPDQIALRTRNETWRASAPLLLSREAGS